MGYLCDYFKNACCIFGVSLDSNQFQWYLELFDHLSIDYSFLLLLLTTHPHSTLPVTVIRMINCINWSSWWHGLKFVSHIFKNNFQCLGPTQQTRRRVSFWWTSQNSKHIDILTRYDSNYDHSSGYLLTQTKHPELLSAMFKDLILGIDKIFG